MFVLEQIWWLLQVLVTSVGWFIWTVVKYAGWMIWIVVKFVGWLIWVVLKFSGTKCWTFLCFCWRKVCTLQGNCNWFGNLFLVVGYVVKARIFYLSLKKEGKNVPVTVKESSVDEETILWIVAVVIDILGNSIAPIDEALVKVIKELQRALEEKDLRISIMKVDVADFLEQRNHIKEKYKKSREVIDQLITESTALKEEQKLAS